MRPRSRRVLLSVLFLATLVPAPASALRSDGLDPSLLAPGLVQANRAVERLERLADEAEAIGIALFRVHNEVAERQAIAGAEPDCETPWLLDLGARAREFGRGFRDAVQSARVQARRVEGMIAEPTIQPLLDPETTHRMSTLLARVDVLEDRYPEAASWQKTYVEPLLFGCQPGLVPAPGLAVAAPPVAARERPSPNRPPRPETIAVIAFGGGWLCPGAVPAAGVMLVAGGVCYSDSESCDCEPATVAPATVLGPDPKAGSAN